MPCLLEGKHVSLLAQRCPFGALQSLVAGTRETAGARRYPEILASFCQAQGHRHDICHRGHGILRDGRNLKSQVARKSRPLYPEAAQNGDKEAQNSRPLTLKRMAPGWTLLLPAFGKEKRKDSSTRSDPRLEKGREDAEPILDMAAGKRGWTL